MQNKYKALLRYSEQRLLIGKGRLAQLHQHLSRENAKLKRLVGELALQKQLEKADDLVSVSLNRAQLFDWLRKTAVDQNRTQALRLELHHLEELIRDCHKQLDTQRTLCFHLQRRRDRYREFHKEEKTKFRLREMNVEECEIEERVSWYK